jgi:hypothetical protein
MDFLMSRKSTTLPPVQPAITEPAALPPVTFSPEKLAELLNMLTDQKEELAALKEQMVESNKRKMDTYAKAPTMSVAGKSERSIQNELQTIRAFAKAGFKDNRPHETIKTFNRWMAEGLRPMPGSKSLRVANLRLFHRSQCQAVTAAEKTASKDQSTAAVERHDKAAKTAKVVPINGNPQ